MRTLTQTGDGSSARTSGAGRLRPVVSDPRTSCFLAPSRALVVLAAQRASHGPARSTLPQVGARTRHPERHAMTTDMRQRSGAVHMETPQEGTWHPLEDARVKKNPQG
jgi:hypothetical protein